MRANSRMYDTVRRIGGKRYDRSLYDGMLRIYNSGMTGKGINRSLADALADSVRSRNRSHSRLLKLQIRLTLMLQKLLPARLARQLPVAAYLLREARWRKKKTAIISTLIEAQKH